MPVRLTPAHIRNVLHQIVAEMEYEIDRFVNSPGKDFSRHRLCTFSNTIFSIMTMETHSLKRELFEFFRPLGKEAPTKSAFVQSRKKLNASVFPQL